MQTAVQAHAWPFRQDASIETSERETAAASAPSVRPAHSHGLPVALLNAELAGADLVRLCHGASAAAGWWRDLTTGQDHVQEVRTGTAFGRALVGQKLMLVVSEVAEAMEGHRKGLQDDKLPHRPMVEVELADAVIRIADLAGALGVDLGGAIAEKLAFNAQRPDHKPEARQAAGGKAY